MLIGLANQEKTKLEEKDVPKVYQKHWRVFSEAEAERLPPTREEDNHKFLKFL